MGATGRPAWTGSYPFAIVANRTLTGGFTAPIPDGPAVDYPYIWGSTQIIGFPTGDQVQIEVYSGGQQSYALGNIQGSRDADYNTCELCIFATLNGVAGDDLFLTAEHGDVRDAVIDPFIGRLRAKFSNVVLRETNWDGDYETGEGYFYQVQNGKALLLQNLEVSQDLPAGTP
jgi:hypothetical protein